MAAPLNVSKNFMNRRPNERLVSKIKLGGFESAHDFIFSAAVAQLSPMAIVDDLKKQGHQYSLEHVMDIIKVHHPEEDNKLYEGSMFTARFILEVDRNGNLPAAGIAEKASIRGVGGRGSAITPGMVIRILDINRQAITILTRGRKQEGWEDAVLCLFILGYSPEETNSICLAFNHSCPPNNLLHIQNIIKEAHHTGGEQPIIIWQAAARILDPKAKSYILNAFLFNIPIHEITENLHIHGYDLWRINDNLVGGYLVEKGFCERIEDTWIEEQISRDATVDELRQDVFPIMSFLEEKNLPPIDDGDDEDEDDGGSKDEKEAADAVHRVARLGSWRQ